MVCMWFVYWYFLLGFFLCFLWCVELGVGVGSESGRFKLGLIWMCCIWLCDFFVVVFSCVFFGC